MIRKKTRINKTPEDKIMKAFKNITLFIVSALLAKKVSFLTITNERAIVGLIHNYVSKLAVC